TVEQQRGTNRLFISDSRPHEERFRIRKLCKCTRHNVRYVVRLDELLGLKRNEDQLLHTAHVSSESGTQQRGDLISASAHNKSRGFSPFLGCAIAKPGEGCGRKSQGYRQDQGRHRLVGTQAAGFVLFSSEETLECATW